MKILAIESSCDETAAAIVKDGRKILSSCISSQIKLHRKYSGVVPELASRAHVETINQVVEAVLKRAPVKPDAMAVTVGPGLVGSLLVGKMTAETLAWVWGLPIWGINHIEGHLLSPLLSHPDLKPPFLGLVVSGGHTEIISVPKWGVYELMGRTRDDAAGEAFDKVAKMLHLGYPGGPVIDKLASEGNADRHAFPYPWLPGTWDFSFSGLKTAVLYRLREIQPVSLKMKKDICAGFQRSVVKVLVGKTMAAAKSLNYKTVVVGGGVCANSELRKEIKNEAHRNKIRLALAPMELCTDNAAMIGAAAYFKVKYAPKIKYEKLSVQSSLHIPFKIIGKQHFSGISRAR